MQYDAVAVSATDLTAGRKFFEQYRDKTIPWVSANIYKEGGELLFPGHIIKDTGNLTVGIIGVTGQGKNSPTGLTVGEWQSALAKEVAVLEHQCDILIVLSNLHDREHQKIVENYPQIDILITGSRHSGNKTPENTGNCLITQSGSRGKYIGKLDIEWRSSGKWQSDPTRTLTQLQQRLNSINRQIKQLRQREQTQPGKHKQKLERMKAYQHTVQGQVEQKTAEFADGAHASASRFNSSFLPVRPSASPAAMQRIVQDIKQSINSLNRSRSYSIRKEDKRARDTLQLATIGDYSGCRRCHADQVAFWQNTGHAKAYSTLESRGQAYNLDCLPCHVTGGTVDHNSPESEKMLLLVLPEHRKNIGCGTCHGQTEEHLHSPESQLPSRSPAETICTGCHTQDRDGGFSFTTKVAHIACPGRD